MSELLHGVHRAAFVDAVLESFPIADIDTGVARAHARLWADLAAAGAPIGADDLWLAATCVARGWTLVTAHVREFDRVNGLACETW